MPKGQPSLSRGGIDVLSTGMDHDWGRSKWRRWVEYLVIAACLVGTAILVITALEHMPHDVNMTSRLIFRGIILLVIAVIAGLDFFFPKGQPPNS